MTVAPVVKLVDFGFSKSKLMHSAAHSLVGTAMYIAPEAYLANYAMGRGADEAETKYDSFKADTWSLGVVLLTFFRWSFPFQVANTGDDAKYAEDLMKMGQELAAKGVLHTLVLRQLDEANTSTAAHLFLMRCFTLNAEDRPTPATLLNDPWIKAGEPYPQARAGFALHFRFRR